MAEFEIPPEAIRTTVYVTNISSSATERAIQEFFAFCGAIRAFQVGRTPDGTQHAAVTFNDSSAWQTAILLNDAQIVDRQILVRDYADAFPEAAAAAAATPAAAAPEASVPSAPESAPADAPTQERKSRTAIMAEMTAKGYELGCNAVAKAREFDEKYFDIVGRTQAVAAVTSAKLYALNEKYKVSERVAGTLHSVDAKATELAEKYKVADKARDLEQRATAAGAKVMANATVAHAVETTRNLCTQAVAAVQDFAQQTADEIARRKAMRDAPPTYEEVHAVPGASTAAATPAAATTAAPAAAAGCGQSCPCSTTATAPAPAPAPVPAAACSGGACAGGSCGAKA